MKVTKFFGLWILSVLCVLSCTDEEQGTGNIVPNVATAPVKLSLDATPMRGTVSTTRTRGDNSLDLVLGEEAGKNGKHCRNPCRYADRCTGRCDKRHFVCSSSAMPTVN